MEKLKITIIMAVFNAVNTIEQAMLSVILQDYENIEFILIDGGSKDGTCQKIKEYEDAVAYWVSEPDHGIYNALNKGIDKATGDYIYVLGADDCLASRNTISKVAVQLAGNEWDVLSGPVWMVDTELGIQQIYTNRFTLTDIYIGYCIPHQGLFVRADLLKKYHFDEKYKIAADCEMFYRLYFDEKIRFKYIDEKIAYYANEGISSVSLAQRLPENVDIMRRYHFEEGVISAYSNQGVSFRTRLKEFCRRGLYFTGMLKYWRMYRGWVPHTCPWDFCRWCRRQGE